VTASSSKARRTSPWAALAYVLVLLMTLYAFAINVMTIATNDYRSIVVQAVGVAGLAVLLVFAIWRRVPAAARVMLVLCILANLYTLFDAGGRRLPAVMGW
jgi:protein-S-isoprenylcysteine O-methyltransferase Ste14